MRKIINLIFLLSIFISASYAQNSEDILLTIDGQQITSEEFLRIYRKNNQNIQSGEKTDMEEYLDMFINFKLKVIEAEKKGIDTISSVENEIEKYKNELTKPYLLDSQALTQLTKEAYERSTKEVRARHILIKLPRILSYEDTLFTYEKAMGIKKRITVKEEDFTEVAKATSDDPSVKSNGGDVGYFSVFQMVYPFEDAVYQMEKGEISDPVRTRFGYHIIEKTGEREAKGKIKVAHIMILAPASMSEEKKKEKKERINDIYHKIMGGAEFSEMAEKYSDDKGSAVKGGELPWFGVGRMVPSFEQAAFSLENVGEISKPVRTNVGWHIIKLLDKKEIEPFEIAQKTIKRKVRNAPRQEIARDSLIQNLKAQYGYEQDSSAIKKLIETLMDEEDKKDKLYLNRTSELAANTSILFRFDDMEYTISDFIEYLNNLPEDLSERYKNKYLFDMAFEQYTTNEILNYEKENLPKKYPEYKYVVKEYHDGILLFEIMDRKVWSKASRDSVGLRNYYEENKENYKWGERYKGKIYFCDSRNTLEKIKKLKKGGLFRKAYSDEEILSELNTADNKRVEIKEDIFHKGENPIIDYHVWNIGNEKNIAEKRPYFIEGEIIDETVKTLEEARGAVIADYQNYLEKEWIKELRNKYEININQQVLEKLKEKQN